MEWDEEKIADDLITTQDYLDDALGTRASEKYILFKII